MPDLLERPKIGDTVWVRATVAHDLGDGVVVDVVAYGGPEHRQGVHDTDYMERGEVAGCWDAFKDELRQQDPSKYADNPSCKADE